MMIFILLFFTSILAGALNSIAGGGSFFTFPILLFTGMNPIIANATNTIAVWPGTIASVAAYRREIAANKAKLPMLLATSFIGSVAGSFILLCTPSHTFERLIPYLILFATLLFAFGGTITRKLRESHGFQLGTKGSIALQLAIACYGGYFGGGMGIMMLAMLALIGLTQMHEMNALKTVLGTVINGVAVVIFIAAGKIAWPEAIVMIIGAIIGGYFGAYYSMKIPAIYVRRFVIVVGCLLTVYFFMK